MPDSPPSALARKEQTLSRPSRGRPSRSRRSRTGVVRAGVVGARVVGPRARVRAGAGVASRPAAPPAPAAVVLDLRGVVVAGSRRRRLGGRRRRPRGRATAWLRAPLHPALTARLAPVGGGRGERVARAQRLGREPDAVARDRVREQPDGHRRGEAREREAHACPYPPWTHAADARPPSVKPRQAPVQRPARLSGATAS